MICNYAMGIKGTHRRSLGRTSKVGKVDIVSSSRSDRLADSKKSVIKSRARPLGHKCVKEYPLAGHCNYSRQSIGRLPYQIPLLQTSNLSLSGGELTLTVSHTTAVSEGSLACNGFAGPAARSCERNHTV